KPPRNPARRDRSAPVLGVFARAVLGWYRRRARRAGIADGRSGTVTVVQRFGSGLGLNVPFHVLRLDGCSPRARTAPCASIAYRRPRMRTSPGWWPQSPAASAGCWPGRDGPGAHPRSGRPPRERPRADRSAVDFEGFTSGIERLDPSLRERGRSVGTVQATGRPFSGIRMPSCGPYRPTERGNKAMAKARDAAPVWPPTRLPCGMAGELDHLLEGRAVGPAHRVADESRGEADPRRLRSPGRRIKPLGGGELVGRRLHRGPQRRPARIQAPVAAIPPAEGALDRRAQRGPEIL